MANLIEEVRYGPAGHPYDILHWPPAKTTPVTSRSQIDGGLQKQPEPRLVILFVPGNPGLVDYYRFFLSTVHGALPSGTHIYAVGHLGHTTAHAPRAFRSKGMPDLQDQVQHKIGFIDEIKELHNIGDSPDQARLILLSHSIGSWISLRIMKARPELVHAAHLLFPTVSHMKTTPNGKRLTPLFGVLQSPAALATNLLSFFPKALLLPIVKLVANQTGPGADVTTSLISSSGTIVATLYMAGKEMAEVTELDKDLLLKFGDRLVWYWAAGDDDGWVSQSSIKEIQDTLKEAGYDQKGRMFRCEEGMQHAFVMSSGTWLSNPLDLSAETHIHLSIAHSKSLAEKSASWIRTKFQL
jgi:pimeloyl-ACP methyl ester carboxylesterase